MSVHLSVRSATLALTAGALAVSGAVVAGAPASAADKDKTTLFAVQLNGAQEVPGPGDADGTGVGVLHVDRKTGRICYTLNVNNIAPAFAAHIHEAARGVAGPVVKGLNAPTNGRSEGCVVDAVLAKKIVKDPADYYLNVHNKDFLAGAVRGQIG